MPNATNFLFDLSMGSVKEKPQYMKVGLEFNNVKKQSQVASTFDIRNVAECYCKIGCEFYPEDRMINKYGTSNYNEFFKEFVSSNKDSNGLNHNQIYIYIYIYIYIS